MKNQFYMLMATVALFSASPVLAMDIENEEPKRIIPSAAVPKELTPDRLQSLMRTGFLETPAGQFELQDDWKKSELKNMIEFMGMNGASSWNVSYDGKLIYEYTKFFTRLGVKSETAALTIRSGATISFIRVDPNAERVPIEMPGRVSRNMLRNIIRFGSLLTTEGEYFPTGQYSPEDMLEATYTQTFNGTLLQPEKNRVTLKLLWNMPLGPNPISQDVAVLVLKKRMPRR